MYCNQRADYILCFCYMYKIIKKEKKKHEAIIISEKQSIKKYSSENFAWNNTFTLKIFLALIFFINGHFLCFISVYISKKICTVRVQLESCAAKSCMLSRMSVTQIAKSNLIRYSITVSSNSSEENHTLTSLITC